MSARDLPAELLAGLFSDRDFVRLVLDAVPHPIFVKDEHSHFLIVNRSMCEFMGRSYEELVGKNDHDFVPAELADVFSRIDRLVLGNRKDQKDQ